MNLSKSLIPSLIALSLLVACGGEENNDSGSNNDTNNVDQMDMGGGSDQGGTQDQGDTSDQDVTPDDGTPDASPDLSGEDLGEDAGADAGEDMAEDMESDIPNEGDLGDPLPTDFPCFEELDDAWPFNAAVSPTGMVTATDASGVITATVDASAGGSMNMRTSAFLYLDLDSASMLQIGDYDALSEKTWDLALKRVVIRTNGGASGTGDVSVARLTDTTFDAVTEVPSGATFVTDNAVDGACMLKTDPIGTPYTAFNALNGDNESGSESWYNYGGPGGIGPVAGHVYLVKNAEGTATYKLQIVSWAGGVYELKWAELP